NNVYQNGLRVLETVYLNAYDAKILIDLVQRTYFTVNDQEGIRVREQQNRTAKATSEIKSQIEAIQSVTEREKIDQGLAKTEISLSVIYNGLGIIRDICESPIYKGKIPDGHKTSLDTHRSTINSALTTLIRARQAISSTKITNTSRINAAEAEVARAEGSLQSAEDQLALILAPPRGEDL
ncbi:hypothetical protein COX09_05025, partial [Candidatus Beckwithbacteria bacterium CG23_combo_of_CG06-09_8_20_14_all_47_9]